MSLLIPTILSLAWVGVCFRLYRRDVLTQLRAMQGDVASLRQGNADLTDALGVLARRVDQAPTDLWAA